MKNIYTVVFVTASSRGEARKIARSLLEKRLAACVNILGGIESLFWWKGKIDRGKELLLVIKSRTSKLPGIIKAVKSAHSYDVPEIIALPVEGGYKPYLDWIDGSLN